MSGRRPLITQDLEGHFKAATTGSRAPSEPAPEPTAPYRFPKLAGQSRAPIQSLAARRYGERTMEKMAAFAGGGGTGGANIATGSPEIRNPLLNLINFYLPYDRKTLNQWIRYYDRFQPYIGNCIDIHGEFPISDFHFKGITDPKVQQLFEEQKERANLVEFAFEASREYELIGEVFSFWRWDEGDAMWDDYVMINPDLLEVQAVDWGWGKKILYTYEPPAELKEILRNRDERTEELLEDLDDVVYENLMAGKRIPLDEFNMFSMMRKASPYENRGTSIVLRCIKELMYEDKLREAQYAIADQQITPVQIWKLGDPAAGYMPTEEDLDDFRNVLLNGNHDPLFTIVSHGAINLELVGYTGKLLPVIPEFEWVAKRVLVALFTNESMVTGEGPTYSNAIIAMKVLQGRYQSKRDKFVKKFRQKIFEPLSKAHQIFESLPNSYNGTIRTSRSRRPVSPEIEWNFKLDLTDQAQRIQYLMQLRDKTSIPMKTLTEVLDLDYEATKTLLKEEEGTVFDPVYQAAREKAAESGGGAAGGGLGGGMPGGIPGGLPDAMPGGEAAPGEATPGEAAGAGSEPPME